MVARKVHQIKVSSVIHLDQVLTNPDQSTLATPFLPFLGTWVNGTLTNKFGSSIVFVVLLMSSVRCSYSN
jgi:hypothetical protein